MMYTFAFFFNKFTNWAFGISGFEEFYLSFSYHEECGANTLFLHFLHGIALKAEDFFVPGNTLVEIFYSYADMFNMCRGHEMLLCLQN